MLNEPSPLHYRRFRWLRPLWPLFRFLSKSRARVVLTLAAGVLGVMVWLAVDIFSSGREIEQKNLVLGAIFGLFLVLVIFIALFGRVALRKSRLRAIKER